VPLPIICFIIAIVFWWLCASPRWRIDIQKDIECKEQVTCMLLKYERIVGTSSSVMIIKQTLMIIWIVSHLPSGGRKFNILASIRRNEPFLSCGKRSILTNICQICQSCEIGFTLRKNKEGIKSAVRRKRRKKGRHRTCDVGKEMKDYFTVIFVCLWCSNYVEASSMFEGWRWDMEIWCPHDGHLWRLHFGGRGRKSSVGIATRYGLDGPGSNSVEGRFSAPVQTGPGGNLASYTIGTGSFPGTKRPGRDVDHPHHLAPRLKKE